MTVLSMITTATVGCDYPGCAASLTVTVNCLKQLPLALRVKNWSAFYNGHRWICRCSDHKGLHRWGKRMQVPAGVGA